MLGTDGTSYTGPTVVTTHRIGTADMTVANQTGGGHDYTLVYSCNRRGAGGGYGGGGGTPAKDLPRH